MSRPRKTLRFELPFLVIPDDSDDDAYVEYEVDAARAPTPPTPPTPSPSPLVSDWSLSSPSALPSPPPYSPLPPGSPLLPTPSSPPPPGGSSTALYSYLRRSGGVHATTNWARAAGEARAARASPKALKRNRQRKVKPAAYIVARGRRVCVCTTWYEPSILISRICSSGDRSDVNDLTNGFAYNLHEGYPTLAQAEAALAWLQSQGLTSDEPRLNISLPRVPHPSAREDDLEGHGPRQPSDPWHIVYTGIHPGVFPTAAEAAVNVLGVNGGLRDHRDKFEDAVAAFETARSEGYVHARLPG
uniref:Uncharacterized protein n=1 Tax=Mycena chlorophos TaxID=658473 RepID=A0ABQ0L6V7_MYCCL|nr:predicted protein [Mycena chlorophos]